MLRLALVLAAILVVTVPASSGATANEPARLAYVVGVTDARNTYAGFLNAGLCLADAHGGQGARLTSPRPNADSPAWSADGRMLAFHRSWQDGNINHDAIEMQDEHGHTRAVAETSSEGTQFDNVTDPDWSPDGQRIAFTRTVGTYRACCWTTIYTVRTDGSDLQHIISSDPRAYVGGAKWSPRGDGIVFSHASDLYLTATDGSDVRLLVHDGYAASWSPDGAFLVFTRYRGLTRSDLMIIGVDGRGERVLTNETGEEEDPSWSPEGDWIAFEKRAQCGPRCGGGLEGTDIAVVRPDGSDLHVLRGSALAELDPAWRPPAPPRAGKPRPCVIKGTHRPDTIRGTSRGDLIVSGRGRDVVYGRGGADVIDGGPGPDRLFGGPGNDLFNAYDGRRDVVDGGRGFDTAYADDFDRLRSIERLPGR